MNIHAAVLFTVTSYLYHVINQMPPSTDTDVMQLATEYSYTL